MSDIQYRLRGSEDWVDAPEMPKLLPGMAVSAVGDLDLRSLTVLPEGVTLSAGGSLYLRSLTALPEGVTLSVGGSLYLYSLTVLPEGVTLSAGDNLYLRSLTVLPEGVTLSAGGSLYLRSLTVLPEGVTLSAGDNLYLSSLTVLPEGVTLSAGDNLYLPSLTAEGCAGEHLRDWKEEMADCEAAFMAADPQVGDMCRFLHHEKPFERLVEPWSNRFTYVRNSKLEGELAWRFRMMRPVTVPLADAVRALLSAVRR